MRTPLRQSEWLSSQSGGDVAIKLESLQPTFSFKLRGALNAVLQLAQRNELPGELVTASAGNHGRALAVAASTLGIPLTVYVPEDAPQVKLIAIRRAGARLVTCRDYDEAERLAQDHAAAGSSSYVSPYSHVDVIAGAGTIGLEILEELPGVESIVVPVGGGGLASGVALATSGRAETYGVEVEASCPFTRGFAAGHIVPIDVGATIADGLAGNLAPDTMTFDLVRRHVTGVVTVREAEVVEAIKGLVAEERLIAEGAAATAIAGVLSGRLPIEGRRCAVVLTGANIDRAKLSQIIGA
jgi:threonine dehydratase